MTESHPLDLNLPIFFAPSGTLVRYWFAKFDEAPTIAANFVVSAFILIPTTLIISHLHPEFLISGQDLDAILLLLGTFAAAVVGRVSYQVALTRTDNANGFVTMFFLLAPGSFLSHHGPPVLVGSGFALCRGANVFRWFIADHRTAAFVPVEILARKRRCAVQLAADSRSEPRQVLSGPADKRLTGL